MAANPGLTRFETLQAAIDQADAKALTRYTSPSVTPLTAAMMGTVVSEAHGLGQIPRIFFAELICLTAEQGFLVGKKVRVDSSSVTTGGTIGGNLLAVGNLLFTPVNKFYGVQPDVDATTVDITFGKDGVMLLRKDAGNVGVPAVITPAKWCFQLSAYI